MNLPDPRGFRQEGSSKALEIQRSGPGIMSIQVSPGSGFVVQPWVPDGETTTGGGDTPTSPPPSPPPPLPPVRVSIKTRDPAERYAISNEIYGVNHYGAASPAELREAGVTVVRKGGNAESRYNWAVDATNRGADWYFQIKPDNLTGGISSMDDFVQVRTPICTTVRFITVQHSTVQSSTLRHRQDTAWHPFPQSPFWTGSGASRQRGTAPACVLHCTICSKEYFATRYAICGCRATRTTAWRPLRPSPCWTGCRAPSTGAPTAWPSTGSSSTWPRTTQTAGTGGTPGARYCRPGSGSE